MVGAPFELVGNFVPEQRHYSRVALMRRRT